MPKSALVRRADALETGAMAMARRVEALGVSDDVLREAIETHVQAMRTATTPRGAVDYAARQRSADALLALARLNATSPSDVERAPLVSLTLVAPPRADVIEAVGVTQITPPVNDGALLGDA